MALILNIETATTVCSVSVAQDGKLLAFKEQDGDYSHAENLTVFIQEVIKEANIKLSQLDAIAVSKGPGSYTGLRIGVSTAKGLCYSLEKPLIAVNTLEHLSLALSKGEGILPTHENPRFFTANKLDWHSSIENAKINRSNQTPAEKIMWEIVRANKLGVKFRRQHPIDKFIPDFVCIEKRLIVEVDGKIHDLQKEQDEERTKRLNELGFQVIRFSNEEVMFEIEKVIEKLQQKIESTASSLSFGEGWGEVLICPMIDARRMEVYCAVFDSNGKEIRKTSAEIIDENSFSDILREHKIIFIGDGSAKCKDALSKNSNAIFVDNVFPSAKNMVTLTEQAFSKKQFEDLAYFEPFYLKDFVAGKKKESNIDI